VGRQLPMHGQRAGVHSVTMTARENTNDLFRRILALLDTMEQAQADKVVALARRLKPGLTAEDIRNPHDFPDLDDPDWHFEDGQLAGIQSVRFALHGLSRELEDGEARREDEAGEPPQTG
jgi:hypothetical protein